MDETKNYSESLDKVEQPKKKTSRDELVAKAIKLLAGTLDVSRESDSDMEKIREIRMAILTGTKY